MRGSVNQIKKTEIYEKNNDNKNINNHFQENVNQIMNINTSSNNNYYKDPKNITNQEQILKTKGIIDLYILNFYFFHVKFLAHININPNMKIKSQFNLSPLSSNLNNLIITNQSYSNTANMLQLHHVKRNTNNQISVQKSSDIGNLNPPRSNLETEGSTEKVKTSSKNLYELPNNNFAHSRQKLENKETNKNVRNNSKKKQKNPSGSNFNNNLFLDNITCDYTLNRALPNTNSSTNYNNIFTKITNSNHNYHEVRESYRDIRSKFQLEAFQQVNSNTKDFDEINNNHQGKLSDKNTLTKAFNNPFSITKYDKNDEEQLVEDIEKGNNKSLNINSTDKQSLKNNNEKSKKTNKLVQFSLTPNKNVDYTNSYVKTASLQNEIFFGKAMNKLENLNKLNPKLAILTNNNNTITLGSTNISPVINTNNSNSNSSKINTFNKSYKYSNSNQTIASAKQFGINNSIKNPVLGLNNIVNNNTNQNSNNAIKDYNYQITSTSTNKSVSPNNVRYNLKQYTNMMNVNDNNILDNNMQYQVCNTQDNISNQNRELTLAGNYTNTASNEDIAMDKFIKDSNNYKNFEYAKSKDSISEAGLNNNSENKISQSIKSENNYNPYNNNIIHKKIEKANIQANNITKYNSNNILSTYQTDNNTQIYTNYNTNVSNNNKSGNSISKKTVVSSTDLKNEKLQKKSSEEVASYKATNELKTIHIANKSINLYNEMDIYNKTQESNNKNTTKLNDSLLEKNKLEDTDCFLMNKKENKNEHYKDMDDIIKNKLKKSNDNYQNVSSTNPNKAINTPAILNSNQQLVNKKTRDLEKNNFAGVSNNIKTLSKDKALILNNLNNENILQNFNYASIGYLNSLPIHSNAPYSNKNKNYVQQHSTNNNELINEAKNLAASMSSWDFKNKNKVKENIKNLNPSNIQEKNKENLYYTKTITQNIPIAKSCNLNSNKIFKKNSVYKNNKGSIEKNISAISNNNIINKNSIRNNNTQNTWDLMNKNAINSGNNHYGNYRPNKDQTINSMDVTNNNYNKRDFCRVFNSLEFPDKNNFKKNENQEMLNNINNLKLKSLYSKNQSTKIGQSKNIQIDLYNLSNINSVEAEKLYNIDFNPNSKNKEKTIITDDIEEELQVENKPNSNNISENKVNEVFII